MIAFQPQGVGALHDYRYEQLVANEIVQAVATHYGIKVDRLFGARRTRGLVRARWIAWKLIRLRLGWSTTQLGDMFHRDHTTILHGLERIMQMEQENEGVRSSINALREKLSIPHLSPQFE